jgi:plasmid stabilization system protein ParE
MGRFGGGIQMGIYRVTWKKEAYIKKLKASTYILTQFSNRIAAARIAKAIEDAAEELASAPESYRVVSQKLGYRIKYVKKTNYLIIFSINQRKKLVEIVNIFHNKEDWPRKL